MIALECEVMPAALASSGMRGSSADYQALRTMSICSAGSQRVVIAHITSARFGRIDVVVDHHDQPPHVAVGGGDQRGALGVAGVALPDRDHGHQLRDVLPDARPRR